MTRAAAGIALAALIAVLSGCGEAQGTEFVFETATASSNPSASSPAASPATSEPTPGGEATPIPGGSRIVIDSPDAASTIRGQIKVYGVKADGQTPTWFYFIKIRFG